VVVNGLSHRFLVCRPGWPVTEWTPPQPTLETGHDVTYFGAVFAAVADAVAPDRPLTFVLTWDVQDLPERGAHVVAVVQGDEDGRIPRWSNDVLVTFKCYGTRPPLRPLYGRPDFADALELMHFIRRVALWLPGAIRHTRQALRARGRPRPVYTIPLGYYNQSPRPSMPFAQRQWSVSFAGSGLGPSDQAGWRGRVSTPKDRARAQMREALARLASAAPNEPIKLVAQPTFPTLLPGHDREALTMTDSYSDLLSNTRVCLVPRGNSPETFRFFEAFRAGCVVVCEWLPDHWFYRDAPVIMVRRWSELSDVLLPLLSDTDMLERLHRASVEYWESRCSERALGSYMAEKIALAASQSGASFAR
jgi:Exostosin family